MRRKIFYKSLSLIKRLQDPYYQGAAAELGFYFIFSIVPIITILTQILGYAGVTGIFSDLLDTAFTSNGFLASFCVLLRIHFPAESIWYSSSVRFGLHRKSNFL